MLPFSALDFFLLLAAFFVLLLIVKRFGQKLISYRTFLGIFILYYLIFFFPAAPQAILFVVYGYVIYYLFEYVFKVTHKLPGVILLLAPMILLKAKVPLDFISFAGLSYVT